MPTGTGTNRGIMRHHLVFLHGDEASPRLLVWGRGATSSSNGRTRRRSPVRYCLDMLPSYHEEVSWSCDLCKPRPSKAELGILCRSTRKLKCKKKRKRYQNTIAAPKFAPPQKPHYKESPATLHGQLSIRKSPASLLQKEVDDLSQSFRVQLEDTKLKKRRRLVIPVDDQLDEDIQINHVDAKYENTLTAPKHDSPQKRQEYVPCSSHVHMENNGDSTVNGKWNRLSDSLLHKKIVDLSQSFGIQFERKNLKRRRMILTEDDQLDGDVRNNSAVNERLLETRYENTVIAPSVASPENPHQYATCTHSLQDGTCAGPIVNEKSNRSTNSLLQKEVDDLFHSIRMQSEEKTLRIRRTRLILFEGEQLGQEAKTNNTVNKRLTEGRYEKTVTAIKVASRGKPHQYVYKGKHAGPAEDGISNRLTDNLLQREVDGPFKSFRMQLERKNLRMRSRRLILLKNDQLGEDVQINNEANEGHLKAEKSVNVSSELSDGRFLKKMGLPNECLLDEEVHINRTGQNSPIRGPSQLHPTLQAEEHIPGRKMTCSSASIYEPYDLPAQPIINHIWRLELSGCTA
ncbi:hypothetical protein BHM03_00059495 [Ensete ventricosum]|nr:hypothetical protein BHM03_00059495 [Ensete ventricosum]